MIKEAKLFKNGQSQAVRLPKEFRFEGSVVYANKVGNSVVLLPESDPWRGMIQACESFSNDFMTERDDPEPQEREWPA